jgi:alkaline phosphatase
MVNECQITFSGLTSLFKFLFKFQMIMCKKINLLTIVLFASILSCFSQKKNREIRNIILMIGDGMGTAQIYAGLTANKGKLNLERCTSVGFHKTQSSDKYVTDSAAGATAFACGKKTYNGAIAVDDNKAPITTILEIAENQGLATGLIATCSITHATPACFIAHQSSRTMDEEIAYDFLRTDIDLFIGGGRKFFTQRKDGKNLADSLKGKKYQLPILWQR